MAPIRRQACRRGGRSAAQSGLVHPVCRESLAAILKDRAGREDLAVLAVLAVRGVLLARPLLAVHPHQEDRRRRPARQGLRGRADRADRGGVAEG